MVSTNSTHDLIFVKFNQIKEDIYQIIVDHKIAIWMMSISIFLLIFFLAITFYFYLYKGIEWVDNNILDLSIPLIIALIVYLAKNEISYYYIFNSKKKKLFLILKILFFRLKINLISYNKIKYIAINSIYPNKLPLWQYQFILVLNNSKTIKISDRFQCNEFNQVELVLETLSQELKIPYFHPEKEMVLRIEKSNSKTNLSYHLLPPKLMNNHHLYWVLILISIMFFLYFIYITTLKIIN